MTMKEVSAVVVSHRSAAEAATAVASLRRALEEAGVSGEVVLVDCGSGPEELPALQSAAADRLLSIENRGYSGGVNAGIAASRGRLLLLCNADVEIAPGALAPLLAAAARPETGAAAPVQHADSAGRILLPTGFGAGFGRDLGQAFGNRGGAARRFAGRAREEWRLWTEGGETDYLAGSILATRREVLDRVGRFDERFPFEFEETEWEDRIRAAGFRLLVVAGSRARHAAGISASRNPETAARRSASRSFYRRRRYGRAGAALLAAAETILSSAPAAPPLTGIPARGAEWAAAFSPNPSVLPFAGVSLAASVDAREIAAVLGGAMYVRVFRTADGRPEPIVRALP